MSEPRRRLNDPMAPRIHSSSDLVELPADRTIPVDAQYPAAPWTRDGSRVARCPECDRAIAVYIAVFTTVTIDDWDGDPDTPVPVSQRDERRQVGWRVALRPGFVNARGHHPSGIARWYTFRADSDRPAPKVRLPAVATCPCGRHVRLDGADEVARTLATATDERRREIVEDQLIEDAGDRWIQQQIDLERGK